MRKRKENIHISTIKITRYLENWKLRTEQFKEKYYQLIHEDVSSVISIAPINKVKDKTKTNKNEIANH